MFVQVLLILTSVAAKFTTPFNHGIYFFLFKEVYKVEDDDLGNEGDGDITS